MKEHKAKDENTQDEDMAIVEEGESFRQQDLAAKVQELKSDLAQCRAERDEYLAGWQRSKADFINARKEEAAAREKFSTFAEEQILEEIVHVATLFDHAFAGKAQENPYVQGFSYIRDDLYKFLERHGATPIETLGKPFDASCHEAIESVPVDNEMQDGIITEETEKGFLLHGKVIRPAKVKVAAYKK